MDLPLVVDALPDDDVPAAIERRAVLEPAQVRADLDRRAAVDVELRGLEVEAVSRAVGELEQGLDGRATPDRPAVQGQDLGIVGVAGRDLGGVVERKDAQKAPPGGGDSCAFSVGHGDYRLPWKRERYS